MNRVGSNHSKISLPIAILMTLAMVIIVRELSVWICSAFGYASVANIVGMVTLFCLLLLWRLAIGLPRWLTTASSVLLLDSGFAFLPVSAGAGLLIFQLGDEMIGFIITIIVSTLLPLWGLARLSDAWLKKVPITKTEKSAVDN